MHRLLLPVLLSLPFPSSLVAQAPKNLELQLVGGKQDAAHVPVCVPLSLSKYWAEVKECSLQIGAQIVDAELTVPALTTEQVKLEGMNTIRRDLHFILPRVKAGEKLEARVDLEKTRKTLFFFWGQGPGMADLMRLDFANGKPTRRRILRYMHHAYDDSSKDHRNKTYKVFHHLYDPTGQRIVTNGGHTDAFDDEKKLLYPHHRGLQMGFNKCTYDGGKKRADTWHCQKDDHQSHEGFVGEAHGGPVLGRHRVLIDWHGEGKKVFAREERELTVFHLPGGTLVEFASRLKPTAGPVKLDGDPQHAGFQFRAHNDVATRTAKQTYYLRPDGKDEPGKTRNWPEVKSHANLPWNAMSFVLDGKRYTACYLNHPSNPGEQRYSERDYGRFGCYFEYDLTEERPLVVHYRIWLQEGEMTAEQVQALWNNFAQPPKVTVK